MPESLAHFRPEETAVIVIDHGSQRAESNDLLLAVVDEYRRHKPWMAVEPAHMELAEPTLATAFRRCVKQGAKLVVVFPYFLGPGRHWDEDIPRLAAEAARAYPEVQYVVTGPLGLHSLVLQVIDERIAECLHRGRT